MKQIRLWRQRTGGFKTMHRMVMEAYCGLDERFIGHTDGNNLNNQRSNLHWKKRRRHWPRGLPGGVGIPALGAPSNTRWPTIRRAAKDNSTELLQKHSRIK